MSFYYPTNSRRMKSALSLGAYLKDGNKRIGDGELVAITLMIAESNPEEKDIMVKLVMNLLDMK